MDFIRIATLNDFRDGNIKSFSILGKKIGVFFDNHRQLRAIEVSCKHQGADLTKGKISENVACCPRHGWKYDLLTGRCINHDSLPLRKYRTKIENDDVFVSVLPID